jgi:hypothetical protein
VWLSSRLHVFQYVIKTLEDGLKAVDGVRTPLQQVTCVNSFHITFSPPWLCAGGARQGVLHIRQVALICVLGARMCVLQSSDVHFHGARRGLEFKHIDPNLFAFCKKVSEEMRVSL